MLIAKVTINEPLIRRSLKEFSEMSALSYVTKPAVISAIIGIGSLALGVYSYSIVEPNLEFDKSLYLKALLATLFAAPLGLVSFIAIAARNPDSLKVTHPNLPTDHLFTANESGLVIETSETRLETTWSSVIRWRAKSDGIGIVLEGGFSYFIPIENFISEQTKSQLVNYLENKA